MMGNPLSLSKAEHIELVAGRTDLGARDCVPNQDIFWIKHKPVKNGIFEADPAIPAWHFNDSVILELPEQRNYKHEKNLKYSDDSSPLAMNEIEVPDSELMEYNDLESDLTPAFKKHFYRTAASLSALDTAAEHVETALRDGLGIELEMDEALQSAFVSISRLDAIAAIIKNTGLSQIQQESYIEKLTQLVAEKTMHSMDVHDKGVLARRAIEMTKEMNHARVRPTQENDAPSQTQLGVRGSRR